MTMNIDRPLPPLLIAHPTLARLRDSLCAERPQDPVVQAACAGLLTAFGRESVVTDSGILQEPATSAVSFAMPDTGPPRYGVRRGL